MHVHSRSISFWILCLTQWGVGDSGQPVRVRCQDEQTEASSVNARHSELLDLPDWYEQRSSSRSKSREYSIKNTLISTISNSSSGRSLSFYRKHRFQLATDNFSGLIHPKLYNVHRRVRRTQHSIVVFMAQRHHTWLCHCTKHSRWCSSPLQIGQHIYLSSYHRLTSPYMCLEQTAT